MTCTCPCHNQNIFIMGRNYFGLLNKYILGTNWLNTIRVNLHYFPVKQAIKLPILVSRRVVLKQLRGGVKVDGPLTTGMLLFGYQGVGFIDSYYERTIWDLTGELTLKGTRIDIGRGSKLCVYGKCFLGDKFSISGRSTIICNKEIRFGDNVLLSWDVLIMDTDLHRIQDPDGNIINPEKAIVIGDNVWIGCRATVLKGSSVPSNSVIAANSTVTGRMDKENCIYSSNRIVIKEDIHWQR